MISIDPPTPLAWSCRGTLASARYAILNTHTPSRIPDISTIMLKRCLSLLVLHHIHSVSLMLPPFPQSHLGLRPRRPEKHFSSQRHRCRSPGWSVEFSLDEPPENDRRGHCSPKSRHGVSWHMRDPNPDRMCWCGQGGRQGSGREGSCFSYVSHCRQVHTPGSTTPLPSPLSHFPDFVQLVV